MARPADQHGHAAGQHQALAHRRRQRIQRRQRAVDLFDQRHQVAEIEQIGQHGARLAGQCQRKVDRRSGRVERQAFTQVDGQHGRQMRVHDGNGKQADRA